jgi:hypothetical protein
MFVWKNRPKYPRAIFDHFGKFGAGRGKECPGGLGRGGNHAQVTSSRLEAILGESSVFTRSGYRRSGPRTTVIHPARTLRGVVWFAILVRFRESRL